MTPTKGGSANVLEHTLIPIWDSKLNHSKGPSQLISQSFGFHAGHTILGGSGCTGTIKGLLLHVSHPQQRQHLPRRPLAREGGDGGWLEEQQHWQLLWSILLLFSSARLYVISSWSSFCNWYYCHSSIPKVWHFNILWIQLSPCSWFMSMTSHAPGGMWAPLGFGRHVLCLPQLENQDLVTITWLTSVWTVKDKGTTHFLQSWWRAIVKQEQRTQPLFSWQTFRAPRGVQHPENWILCCLPFVIAQR